MSKEKFDAVDRFILNKLQENARRAFKGIADEIGVSEATVFLRVKKLQEKGVIKGFKAILDLEMVGKGTKAIMLLKADPKLYQNVLDELRNMEEICEIYDVTGAYYTVLKIRGKNNQELSRVLDEIGAINGIIATETSIILKSIKEETSIKL
ncbi:MAG: Lrp/AsnC family transcriptional regulator [Candidatus Bathyarchaeota archaeon]|nr:Lrp/AsnC family transcriptional regulator [Candidatus Bathyarchaeota archaeon]